jgi:choice-of-anchor B domain-containing protein
MIMGVFIYGQDSLNMTQLSNLDNMPGTEYNDIWGYTDASGNEFAIVGSSDAINIVDVTDCQNPVLDTSYVDGSSVIWRDFKTYQNFVYAVCDGSACQNEGLQIIDMDTKTFTQSNAQFNKAHNIYIDEQHGRLYAVGVNGGQDLVIYDLTTTPGNPVHLASIDFGAGVPNYIHDIYVRDHIAYASHGFDGFAIYDVTTATNPSMLGSYTSPGYNHSSWNDSLSGISYVAFEVPTGVPINILEIGNNYSITKKGDFSHPLLDVATKNRPHNPFIKGDSLYISYYHDGTQVWNISDKLDPKIASYFETDNSNSNYNGYISVWGHYPYFDSGCLVSSDIGKGLFTFKLLPAQVNIEDTYLIFESNQLGLILRDEVTATDYLIGVETNGTLTLTPYSGGSGSETKLNFADIHFDENNVGVVLMDDMNRHHHIKVDANNAFYTNRFTPPTERISSHKNLMFDNGQNGVYVKNDNGEKLRISVVNGALVVKSWPF